MQSSGRPLPETVENKVYQSSGSRLRFGAAVGAGVGRTSRHVAATIPTRRAVMPQGTRRPPLISFQPLWPMRTTDARTATARTPNPAHARNLSRARPALRDAWRERRTKPTTNSKRYPASSITLSTSGARAFMLDAKKIIELGFQPEPPRRLASIRESSTYWGNRGTAAASLH